MRGRWGLSDVQWELIEPTLRPKRRTDGRGRRWQDTRAVFDGILWILGTGAQWRELPTKYRRTRPASVASSIHFTGFS
jgi:transposase